MPDGHLHVLERLAARQRLRRRRRREARATCRASSTTRTRRSAPATSPCSRRPPRSSCPTAIARSHVATGDFPLTLVADGGKARFSGFITGNGSLRIEAPPSTSRWNSPGRTSNSYQGTTTLARGVLKLSKPGGAIAIPGNLTLGGSAAENKGDARDLGGRRPDRPVRGRDAAGQPAVVPGPERPQGRVRQARAVEGGA